MAFNYIQAQPLKWWDSFETSKLEAECFSKEFCLPVLADDNFNFILENTDAESQLFSNNEFDSGLIDWNQSATGFDWVDITCDTENVANATAESKWLFQVVTINNANCYTFCIQLCGELTSAPSCKIQIGYTDTLGTEPFTVVYDGYALNTNDRQCASVDLSGLSNGDYAFGIRIVDSLCGLNYSIQEFSMFERACSVDVVDCDCEDVLANITANTIDEATGQALYTFNATDLGLSEGVYRINADTIGCSSCIQVVSSLNGSYVLYSTGNIDGVFGFTWSLFKSGSEFTDGFRMRLPRCELRYAGWEDKESEVYRDSAYKNKLPYFDKQKSYELVIDQVPEYVHDFISILCSGSEYFSIFIGGNEKRFRINPDDYTPNWTKKSDLGGVRIKLWEYQESFKINVNASNMD